MTKMQRSITLLLWLSTLTACASPTMGPPPAMVSGTAGWEQPTGPSYGLKIVLPEGRGIAYQEDATLYVERPGQPREAVLTLTPGSSAAYIDPQLRYVLLHERMTYFEVVDFAPQPAPSAAWKKEAGYSRLVKQPIGVGERVVLIERFYNYAVDVAMSPHGHTLAVRTQITPENAIQSLITIDMDRLAQKPLVTDRAVQDFKWSPDGKQIAFFASVGAPVQTGLYVVALAKPDIRELHVFPNGPGEFVWLEGSQALAAARMEKKFDRFAYLTHLPLTGPMTEDAVEIGSEAAPAYLTQFRFSPDGSRVLAQRMIGEGGEEIVIERATKTWSRVAASPGGATWAASGAELRCPTSDGFGPCALN